MLRRLLSTLAPIALAALASRCANDSGVVGSVTNRCARDADCADGVCDLALRRCVATARPEVFFALAPARGAASMDRFPTLTPSRALRSGDAVNLRFRGARTLYGTVVAPAADGAGAPELVPATVEFVPSGAAGVVSPIQAVGTSSLRAITTGEGGSYSWTATVADGLYDVIVRPPSSLAARIPPRFEQGFDVRSDALVQRFDIAYPRTFSRWSGVVRDRTGAAVPGLTVRGVDVARDAMLVSTVARTDGDATRGLAPGSFAVDLAPGAPESWALRVSSDAGAGGWLTVELPAAARAAMDPQALRVELSSLAGLPVDPTAAPPSNGAPCNDCVEVLATVEGGGDGAAARALRNATVTFRTPVTFTGPEGSRAWFECRATTDAEGALRAWLIPGDYDVIVTPPASAFTTAVVRGFRVRSDAGRQSGQIFTARPRIAVEGRVVSPMGAAIANAHVTAIPFQDAYVSPACLADPDLRLLATRATPAETTTGGDGAYRVDVDPGLYRLLVEPSDRSGFPATLSASICVGSAVSAFDVSLDAPVEVRGTLRDAAGEVAAGATVEAVVRIREEGAAGVAVRVARATSGADGAWSMLVPSGTVAQ